MYSDFFYFQLRSDFWPMIKASYSASLLVALKSNLTDCSMMDPSGVKITIPAPEPAFAEEPSM